MQKKDRAETNFVNPNKSMSGYLSIIYSGAKKIISWI